MMHDFTNKTFEFRARHHDEMAAALAFKPKIHADAQISHSCEPQGWAFFMRTISPTAYVGFAIIKCSFL